MFVAAILFRTVEIAFESGRANVDGKFPGFADDGLIDDHGSGSQVVEAGAVASSAESGGRSDVQPGSEVERNGNARSEFRAGNEFRSVDEFIGAARSPGEGVKGKIERETLPRSLVDRADTKLGEIAQGDAGCRNKRRNQRGKGEKALVVDARDVEAEALIILGEEDGAAYFRVDGFAKSVREGQTEGEGGKLIVIGDETPAAGEQGFDFEALIFAAFGLALPERVNQAAIIDAKIVVGDGSVFSGQDAQLAAFAGAAEAEILRAERGVHPAGGGEVKGVAKDQALNGTVADIRDEKASLANFGACRGVRIREPNEGNAKEAKVGVDQSDFVVELDVSVCGEELPTGMFGIANGDPCFADHIDVFAKPLDFFAIEIQRVFRDEDGGIGFSDDFHRAMHVMEETVAGADVVMRVVSIEMLIFEVVFHVAGGDDLGSRVIVLNVVGGKTGVAIDDHDVVVREVQVALAALRTAGRDFGELAFGVGEVGLLWRSIRGKLQESKEGAKKQRGAEGETTWSLRERIHAVWAGQGKQ